MRAVRFPGYLASLMLLSLALSSQCQAELPSDPFSEDGWYRWEVMAVAEAKEWCCYSGYSNGTQRTPCTLDGKESNYVAPNQSPNQIIELEASMQIFARVSKHQFTRMKVVSSGCEVGSKSPWTDLGPVSAQTSLRWLTTGVQEEKNVPDGWLTAIAVTEGEQSRELLETLALEADQYRLREQAIFWMGQLRFEESRDTLLQIMTTDPEPSIREQAIFSLSQSPAGDRLELLITLVEDADRPMTDRKRALFWLAQTDDGKGVDYIQSLLLRP